MFVSDLSIEKSVSNRNQSVSIESPNWMQIEAAIRELDGNRKTLITLTANDETHMTIGGGESGKYVISVTFNNINFHNLVDLSMPNGTERLVVGGQEGIYPAKMCVDLLSCLLAARTFTESGRLDPLVGWQEDKSLVMLGEFGFFSLVY